MAALTITASNIVPVAGYRFKTLNAAAAITQGQAVYVTSADTWALADADALVTAACTGIALTETTAAAQPLRAIVAGDLGMGGILTVGIPYYVHTTPGSIGVYGDLSSGDFGTFIGWPTSTSNLRMVFAASTVAI